MRIAVAASALLHLGLIVVTMIAWPGFTSVPPSEISPSIPIELVEIDEQTNIASQIKKPEEQEPEPPEEEEVVEEPEPPEPEETPPAPKEPPPPPPEPEPEPVAEPEPAPEPEPEEPEEKDPPKPEEKKPAPPVKKPPEPVKKDPPKETDPFAEMQALIDKTPDEVQQERKLNQDGEAKPTGEFDIAGVGRQDDMTVSPTDALKYQIEKCWSFDPGRLNAGELVVDMVVYFNADGTLRAGENPRIKNQMRYATDKIFRAAADEAVRAVRACEGSGYDVRGKREVPLRFDPSLMMGNG